jgi:hypothetical protein
MLRQLFLELESAFGEFLFCGEPLVARRFRRPGRDSGAEQSGAKETRAAIRATPAGEVKSQLTRSPQLPAAARAASAASRIGAEWTKAAPSFQAPDYNISYLVDG